MAMLINVRGNLSHGFFMRQHLAVVRFHPNLLKLFNEIRCVCVAAFLFEATGNKV